MSRAPLRTAVRPLAAPAAALALGLALTGCGAGFQAQTYQERTTSDGTNSAVGAIALRNVSIAPPPTEQGYLPGDDAEFAFVLTNDGGEPDRLLEITTEDAAEVTLVGAQGGLVLEPLSTTGEQLGLLSGLADGLRVGEYVELTFRFERAGTKTISVPAATSGEYDYERQKSDNFHPPGSEEEGEGGGLSEAGEETTDEQQGG